MSERFQLRAGQTQKRKCTNALAFAHTRSEPMELESESKATKWKRARGRFLELEKNEKPYSSSNSFSRFFSLNINPLLSNSGNIIIITFLRQDSSLYLLLIARAGQANIRPDPSI